MRWIKIIRNRYFLATLAFLIWMIVFDENNLLRSRKLNQEIKDLSNQETFYLKEIEDLKRIKKELNSNSVKLEKYAREKYFFKKDGETIFKVKKEKD